MGCNHEYGVFTPFCTKKDLARTLKLIIDIDVTHRGDRVNYCYSPNHISVWPLE